MNGFSYIDTSINNIYELTDTDDNKIIIKHYSGINTDNYEIKRVNDNEMKLWFTFSKINNIIYVIINNEHMIEYKKFIRIEQISAINEYDTKIRIRDIGDIKLKNCTSDMVKKALEIMEGYYSKRRSYIRDLMDIIFS